MPQTSPTKSSKIMKQPMMIPRYGYIVIAGIVLLAAFLYLKMIYFPGRNEFSDQEFQLTVTEGDLAHARNIDIQSLSSFTGDYIVSTNAIESLARLYAKTKDEKVALSLIQMYISHNEFDEALKLIGDIYHNDVDFSVIPVTTFLYVLFNSSELSSGRYAVIDNILSDYKQKVRIDDETFVLYSGLLSAYKGEMNSFYEAIESLSGSKQYERLVRDVKQTKSMVETIGSQIPYYRDALTSIALLDNGYFRVAQKVAVSVRQQDDNYILPYQVLGQAALLQSHWQEAIQYFDRLLKIDGGHADQYHFGQCVSYFWQKSYENALFHCQQITDINLLNDAHRYMILSHYQSNNRQGMMTTFQLMLNKSTPSENDFFTFFDMVFYQPFVTDKNFDHIKTYYVSTVLPYLDRCVTTFGADAIVCKYGQAGFYLYKNELERVHKDLLYLASRYPSSYVLRAIGQYYEGKGDDDKAKAYYLKATSLKNGTVVDVSSMRSGAGNNPVNK